MKHHLFIFVMLYFLVFSAQAQQDFVIKTAIGYKYTHNDANDNSAYYNPNYGEKINDLNLSLSIGRNWKSHFNYGLGILYNIIKEEINPESDVPEPFGYSIPGTYHSYTNYIATSHIISPMVYFQYYTNITERLSITFDIYSKYDFDNQRTESRFYYADLEIQNYEEINQAETEIKRQYLNLGIFPSLRFNLFKNFGMDLNFGIIEYHQKTYDSRVNLDKKTKEFNFNINPENWKLGFYITF